MVARIIFRVEADEFTWQEFSTSLEVAKARIELPGVVRPAEDLVFDEWTGDKTAIRDESRASLTEPRTVASSLACKPALSKAPCPRFHAVLASASLLLCMIPES